MPFSMALMLLRETPANLLSSACVSPACRRITSRLLRSFGWCFPIVEISPCLAVFARRLTCEILKYHGVAVGEINWHELPLFEIFNGLIELITCRRIQVASNHDPESNETNEHANPFKERAQRECS